MDIKRLKDTEITVNFIDIIGIVVILLMAFYMQLIVGELPCPLCLLQRVGFLLIAVGFVMNLRFGLRPLHYALSILGAIYTAIVGLRQVLLHIAPDTSGVTGYGEALFGLHMYTWSLLISIAFILWIGFHLLFPKQFKKLDYKPNKWLRYLIYIAFILIILVGISNAVLVYLECGILQCPDNPEHYRYLINK